MNWDDPEERSRLADSVDVNEYNRLFAEHVKSTTVAVVNGWRIRPVGTRFGKLFQIDGAGQAFQLMIDAERFAAKLPKGEVTDE